MNDIRSKVDKDSEPGDKRRLSRDVTWRWYHGGYGYRVTVPEGFAYRPSVPGVLRAVLSVIPNGLAPRYALEDVSAVHDYLYSVRGTSESLYRWGAEVDALPTTEPISSVSRAVADAVMLSGETDPTWLQFAAWLYVRAVGWAPWRYW